MACSRVGAKTLSYQCWGIANWTLKNKLQWNSNQNTYVFIQENAFENFVWEMAAILSRPQCVKLMGDVLRIWFYFLMLFTMNMIFLSDTVRCDGHFGQHRRYWWPGHQQPQCWVRTHAFPPVYGSSNTWSTLKTLTNDVLINVKLSGRCCTKDVNNNVHLTRALRVYGSVGLFMLESSEWSMNVGESQEVFW